MLTSSVLVFIFLFFLLINGQPLNKRGSRILEKPLGSVEKISPPGQFLDKQKIKANMMKLLSKSTHVGIML